MNIPTWVRCDHKPGARDAEKKLRREGSWEETTGRASWRRRYVSRVRKPPGEGKREQRHGQKSWGTQSPQSKAHF